MAGLHYVAIKSLGKLRLYFKIIISVHAFVVVRLASGKLVRQYGMCLSFIKRGTKSLSS